MREANDAIAKIPNAAATSAFEGWGVPQLQERLTSLLRKHKEETLDNNDLDESSARDSLL